MAVVTCLSTGANAQQPNKSIKIVSGYQRISTVKELLSNFKGKPVFVDMWASWCQPCKDEFKYSEGLYKELKKRNIEILYISIDKDTSDVAWEKDMVAFNLSGNHIKANKALRDDLTTMVWGGVDAFSIPNYLLFDANGNVLLKNTLMPDTGNVLLDQLTNTLEKK